ncbi:Transposon Tf2-9 polyprotein [Liparis tanakae]|uniref:Transposon Tf2-9 polyprotein n=1 Tax=Liparis tanakae TaxID=230148 RepID=A0A4Z2F2Q8_9TELE|nr:Transposon Tf2-9 polyprotein [Liparis tanakae]
MRSPSNQQVSMNRIISTGIKSSPTRKSEMAKESRSRLVGVWSCLKWEIEMITSRFRATVSTETEESSVTASRRPQVFYTGGWRGAGPEDDHQDKERAPEGGPEDRNNGELGNPAQEMRGLKPDRTGHGEPGLDGKAMEHRALELATEHRGLEPEHRGLEPEHRGLEPGNQGLEPEHRGLEHQGLDPENRGLGHRGLDMGNRRMEPEHRGLGHRGLEPENRGLEPEHRGREHQELDPENRGLGHQGLEHQGLDPEHRGLEHRGLDLEHWGWNRPEHRGLEHRGLDPEHRAGSAGWSEGQTNGGSFHSIRKNRSQNSSRFLGAGVSVGCEAAPFVLSGTPDTFQRLVDRGLIHSTTKAEHVQRVCAVLESLRQAGLTANPGKCAVGPREAQYLGYHLGGGQVRPKIDKTTAIAAWPRSKNKRGEAVSGAGRLLQALHLHLCRADQPLDLPEPERCLRTGPVDRAVPVGV